MNRIKTIIFSLSTLFSLPITPSQTLTLQHFKSPTSYGSWSLSEPLLKELVRLFKADNFVETGTFYGLTTERAAHYFKKVYSIELSLPLYQNACQSLKKYDNIHLSYGDSATVLPELLKQINGKIIFFLDGHYNGDSTTARGANNTAILDELEAIKQSGIKDAVILIDDMIDFQKVDNRPANDALQGYPSMLQLEEAILAIDKNYQFYIFGDIAIAYPASDNVIVSPVIQACTISRFCNEEKFSPQVLAQAEAVIAQAQEEERATIKFLYDLFATCIHSHGTGGHYLLWNSLIFAYENKHEEARKCEALANSVGIYRH